MVAPFAGAWIEMTASMSYRCTSCVAPFAGAWIEIDNGSNRITDSAVAPFAGAWIEIQFRSRSSTTRPTSLPSRERGLKFQLLRMHLISLPCRSLRGSVD